MALKATVFKAQLQISDLDRRYYETHALTIARYPSELVSYGGRSADIWWQQNAAGLRRLSNLSVIDIPADQVAALTGLVERGMDLQCTLDSGHAWIGSPSASVEVTPTWRQRPS
jgi:uncharacterized protein YaeQ